MDWPALISVHDGYDLRQGADEAEISAAESRLHVLVPLALRDLLAASNGVFDRVGQWFVVWPLSRIVQDNSEAWELEGRDRRAYLGFGDDGTGNPFCMRLDGSCAVFIWSPIEREATSISDDLASFWCGWAGNTIST
ncbi:SMI1/KNR4 family protein [Pseudofrankia sp. DC12]|uniref:SMI1/KNR4 family protein n=1 Tax=Pseudofrankia sp. DC12 TaxID=683315 RepID=UPI000AED4949|nr:SMI1/KNR4 family protein [Pseudofrankia sp. DC12]